MKNGGNILIPMAIAVPFLRNSPRPRKGDNFSKASNQDDNEPKKSNSQSDKNTDKDQSKNKRICILGDSIKGWKMSKILKNC